MIKTIKKRTVFGPTLPTPVWAQWTFRVFIILTTAATFVIATDPGIPDDLKVRIGVYLKGLDLIIYGASKLLGIVEEEV